jgi:hypothetical protein
LPQLLIQSKAEGLFPEWLRFLRGVVDSEDLPLNVSRQNMQDNTLVQKLNKVLTSRLIKGLDELAGKRTTPPTLSSTPFIPDSSRRVWPRISPIARHWENFSASRVPRCPRARRPRWRITSSGCPKGRRKFTFCSPPTRGGAEQPIRGGYRRPEMGDRFFFTIRGTNSSWITSTTSTGKA